MRPRLVQLGPEPTPTVQLINQPILLENLKNSIMEKLTVSNVLNGVIFVFIVAVAACLAFMYREAENEKKTRISDLKSDVELMDNLVYAANDLQ